MLPTKEEIIKIVENNKIEIKDLGVTSLKLFGSFSMDKQKKGSDVDFLVEFEKGRGLFNDISNLKILLEEKLKREVDLVKPKLVRKELKNQILKGKKIEARI